MKSKSTPETTEKSAIKDYLNIIGAFHYPNTAGLGSYRGIPDITAIYKGQVYQIEVKAGKNKQSPAQEEFQIDWELNGGIYICGGIDAVMAKIKR